MLRDERSDNQLDPSLDPKSISQPALYQFENMAVQDFRVIIAGGGVAGLTLANALEKAGIEYVLLEARDEIAPEVGASIGIFQNGGRILDQLGCFEAIEKGSSPLRRGRSRDHNGKQFFTQTGIQLVEAR